MSIEAGKLNKRLTFSSPSTVAATGVTTYTDQFTVWGAVRPHVGNRKYMAQQLNSYNQGTITIRYRSDVEADMHITYGSRTFEILSILNPDEANETLEIDYKEWTDPDG